MASTSGAGSGTNGSSTTSLTTTTTTRSTKCGKVEQIITTTTVTTTSQGHLVLPPDMALTFGTAPNSQPFQLTGSMAQAMLAQMMEKGVDSHLFDHSITKNTITTRLVKMPADCSGSRPSTGVSSRAASSSRPTTATAGAGQPQLEAGSRAASAVCKSGPGSKPLSRPAATNKAAAATATPTTAAASSDRLDEAFIDECIRAHNVYRTRHSAPALTHDPTLSHSAQKWANYLAQTNSFQHSQNRNNVGENIAMMGGTPPIALSGLDTANMWYSEVKYYTFSGEENMACGHFSQLVWVGSTRAGFGRASDASGSNSYVVGQYGPAGNYMGQWATNVLPPKDGKKNQISNC